MNDWFPGRGINGEYGYINIKTGEFRTTLPNSTQEKKLEISKLNKAILKEHSVRLAKFERTDSKKRNHGDEIVKKKINIPIITMNLDGTFTNNYVLTLAPQEESLQIISPEFDLISLSPLTKPVLNNTIFTITKPIKDFQNAKYAFQIGDISKLSQNDLIKTVLNSKLTEKILTDTKIGKRALETVMRTTPAPNPIPKVVLGIKSLPLKPRINYILLGKSPRLRKILHQPNMHHGDNSWSSTVYTGLVDLVEKFPIRKGYGDIIDAYLYKTTIDPKIATLSDTNNGLKFFESYIKLNYPNRNILTYKLKGNINSPVYDLSKWMGYRGTLFDEFRTNNGKATINVAGHLFQMGKTNPILEDYDVRRGFDIWKFNPLDYKKGWDVGNNLLELKGLEFIDKAGTPIIFELPWKTLY